jgi:hypothetical protein
MITTSIERLEEIEIERSEVIADPAFQVWMKELNVSQSWSNPEPLFNAREMNSHYNFGKNKVARLELSTYL